MGLRTGKEPDVTDTFLMRICHALDVTPKELARGIGVSYKKEIEPLLGQRSLIAEIEKDEVWFLISEYVAKRMGSLMAIRFELNRALQADRVRRAAHHNRFRKYHGLNDKPEHKD